MDKFLGYEDTCDNRIFFFVESKETFDLYTKLGTHVFDADMEYARPTFNVDLESEIEDYIEDYIEEFIEEELSDNDYSELVKKIKDKVEKKIADFKIYTFDELKRVYDTIVEKFPEVNEDNCMEATDLYWELAPNVDEYTFDLQAIIMKVMDE